MQIVIFIAFYLILKKFLFAPILKIVNLREALVREKNNEIERIRSKVEELEQKINTLIKESDKEVLSVEGEKLKEILNRKNQMLAEMHRQLLENIEKVRVEYEKEKNKIVAQLENILLPLKQNILSRILQNGK
ncbi:MAG: hypothetical protein ACK4NF_02965 [Planctomycetota bacterium]